MKTELKKKMAILKYLKSFLLSQLTKFILKTILTQRILTQIKEEKSTHLPFNAATPTVLRAMDILATNVHC